MWNALSGDRSLFTTIVEAVKPVKFEVIFAPILYCTMQVIENVL